MMDFRIEILKKEVDINSDIHWLQIHLKICVGDGYVPELGNIVVIFEYVVYSS